MNINICYVDAGVMGKFETDQPRSSVWSKLKSSVLGRDLDSRITSNAIIVPWSHALNVFLSFVQLQRPLGFRFLPENTQTEMLLGRFLDEYRDMQSTLANPIDTVVEDFTVRLESLGFDNRVLTSFQQRDISKLLSLRNGANFSVPGAGKTTVSLALNSLLMGPEMPMMLVVSPKSAFQAWSAVVNECFSAPDTTAVSSRFHVINDDTSLKKMTSAHRPVRAVTNYEYFVNNLDRFTTMLATTPTHLVLDESHRIKAGLGSQRGSALLQVAPIAGRRDILSGTPMPQSANDIRSQLDFLWPGMGVGQRIADGTPPRQIISPLYVRTMKSELGLPQPKREFLEVGMAPGQMALYGLVRSEFLRDASRLANARNQSALNAAKRSVMRLLQISSNPSLALNRMLGEELEIDDALITQILEDGPSPKIRRAVDLAVYLAQRDRKVVIWTIFTETIVELESALRSHGALTYYGATPNGNEQDVGTREWVLNSFHHDQSKMILIANPAAAGEGISLHTACHDAIYLDRSFVSTHYLQSIDRIHRLGLDPEVETNIKILLTKSPKGLGSIDASVSRRLLKKLRGLEELLDDPDLKQLVLDEEEAPAAVDFEIELDDILAVLEELRNPASFDILEEFDEQD